MPLNLKHRPKNFKQFKGSRDVVSSLLSILEQDDKPNAFLFTGPAGCGKTTLAYLVKQHLKVEDCDFVEMDAGTVGNIGTVRDIRQKMHYSPMQSPYRIWFWDEVHRLSNEAQEGFLKALEEGCPSTTKFIFATTESQKLKDSFKRRCAVFHVSALSDYDMASYLNGICRKNKKKVPEEVIDEITMSCGGSPGMALSILETILPMNSKKMLKAVQQKAVEQNEAITLCRTLFKQNVRWSDVRKVLATIDTKNPESLRRMVLAYCCSILKKGSNPAFEAKAYVVLSGFLQPFYDSPEAMLIATCYEVVSQ